jgi:hypothetical protein
MAIASHVQWLKQGKEAWNRRRENRHFVPSLKNADLSGMDLSGMNLRGANLTGANLRNADLTDAILLGSHLINATLDGAVLHRAKITAAVMTGASLQRAVLTNAFVDECDFRRADLRHCDLKHAFLHGSNLQRAIMSEADIRSEDGNPVSLNFVKGITQIQLEQCLGDTGVALPDGLDYPKDWPIWIDPSPSPSPFSDTPDTASHGPDEHDSHAGGFVFLSYSNQDRRMAANIRSILSVSGIRTWWDQDINAGDNWRESIQHNLNGASAVLTLWTSSSVNSSAVIEEAAQAKGESRLFHARMDDAKIPYGFSETQYADLRRWEGGVHDPELRKLIQAIKDKVHPPTHEEIQGRLMAAAPMAAIVEDGKITAKDSPPNALPPFPDEEDLEQRLNAQEALAEKVLLAIQSLDNNLGEAIRLDLNHFIQHVKKRPPSWYILTDSIGDLKFYLELADEVSWPGSTKNGLQTLCRGHEALRPRLQPLQPPLSSPDAPLPPPLPDTSKLSDSALKQIADTASDAFASFEAQSVLSGAAVTTGEYLAVEIDEARSSISMSERSEQQKLKKIRNGVIALAGFVGTTIASIGYGVGGNLLTSPDAAKTLLGVLQKLFDMLTALF